MLGGNIRRTVQLNIDKQTFSDTIKYISIRNCYLILYVY